MLRSFLSFRCIGKTEKILYLTDENGNGDTCGKADGYRSRDKLYKGSEFTKTHYYKNNSRKDGGNEQASHSL